MKPLSLKQAINCENAIGDKCVCRCAGALHGANRGGGTPGEPDLAFFEQLPEDDPHYLPAEEVRAAQRKERAQERAEAKKRERQEREKQKWDFIEKHNRELAEARRARGDWY